MSSHGDILDQIWPKRISVKLIVEVKVNKIGSDHEIHVFGASTVSLDKFKHIFSICLQTVLRNCINLCGSDSGFEFDRAPPAATLIP
jgi:hypothetical protein